MGYRGEGNEEAPGVGRAQEHEGQLGILVEASWLLQQPPQPEIHTRSSFLAHRTPTSGALLLW